MKKKGFTLVELLAVIAILAILVIIALPNIMDLFNQAKKNSFNNELKNIYNSALNQYMSSSFSTDNDLYFARSGALDSTSCSGVTTTELKLSGRTDLKYAIKVDRSGKVVSFVATDGTYAYEYDNADIKVENIGKGTGTTLNSDNAILNLADINATVKIACANSKFDLQSAS